MPPKRAQKKKNTEQKSGGAKKEYRRPKGPKQQKSQTRYELKTLRRKKRTPSYMFRWLKPSRRIGSGGVLKKSASLGRLMRWPKYVKLQRQRKILLQRLKIPPALNIFNNAAGKEFAGKIVKFGKNYTPETSKQKTKRLRAIAKLQAEGKPIPSEKKKYRKST
eukprot:126635_1